MLSQPKGGTVRAGCFIVALLFVFVFGVASAGAAPIGTNTEFSTSSGLNPGANPAQIQAGSDGNLWFSDRSGAVGRITTAGVITEFSSGLNPGASDQSMAMGPDGNMWFSDNGMTRAIGMINPRTGAISEFSSGLNPGSLPLGIAMGPDGNVWFTDNGTTKAIGVINLATHAISEFSTGLNAGSSPQQGLITGPDGNIWFLDSGTRAIGMINPTTHAISEFSTGLNPNSSPNASMVVGPDGALWFNDNGTTKAIGRIDPATHAISEFSSGMNAGANLGRITVAPDGNIWFGDKGTTPSIGFINPTTHAITQYSAGLNAGSLPGGIWTGSDGNVWFTDQGTIRAIGRTVTGAPAASVTPPSVTGSGGAGIAKTCGGDLWSTWAGQQPSHNEFGFDGYQWLLDSTPIDGQTGSSYTPASADTGHQLSCTVTVTYPLLVVTASATSASVLVKGAADQLTDLAAAVAGVGPGHSLAGKVNAIEGYVAANDTSDACSTLDAFISEVNAQTGKKISTAHADSFIAQAQDIAAALGCGPGHRGGPRQRASPRCALRDRLLQVVT
jgi:streptogramin lyase